MKKLNSEGEQIKETTQQTTARVIKEIAKSVRKRSEEALKLEAQLLDAATDSIFLLDLEGNLIYVNEAAYKSRGYTKDELMAMNLKDLNIPEDKKLIELRMQVLMEKGEAAFESAHFCKDGSVMQIEVHARIIEVGAKKLVLSVTRDITERKQAEETLRESEERYRILVDNSLLGIGISHENQVDFANQALLRIFGYDTLDEFKRVPLLDHVAPTSREYIVTRMAKVARGELVPSVFEYDILKKDATIRTLQASTNQITLHGETLTYTIFQDITERRKAEEALKESEQKLINIIEHSSELHYVHDTNHVLSYVSPQSLQILGYTPDEMMVEWTTLVTENPINEMGVEITEKALKTGERQPLYLLELYKKDRSKVLLEIDESPVEDDKGNVVAIVGAARDVTERVKAEKALKNSEQQIRMLLDSTAEAIYGVDLNDKCTFVNAACLRILGYDNESQLLGKHLHELIHYKHPDGSPYPKEQCRIYKAHREGKSMHNDREVFWRADGTSFPVEYRSFPIEEKGKVVGAVVTFLDITERRTAEKEINRRVKELEEFYDMAVGRELRMKELKEEMEDLKEEIGRLKQELDKYKKQ